jgi:hypothetical protein
MLKRLSIPGFLLAAALAFVAAPDGQLAASECGGFDGNACKTNQSCINILFFKQCTTTHTYYPGYYIIEPGGDTW